MSHFADEPARADAADDGGDAALEAAADQIEQDIAGLEDVARQRDEYLALAQRLQAEFENFKKQAIRRRTEDLERAGANLAESLLPVLDAFDNAMIHGIDGVAPIYRALIEVLQKEGLEVL